MVFGVLFGSRLVAKQVVSQASRSAVAPSFVARGLTTQTSLATAARVAALRTPTSAALRAPTSAASTVLATRGYGTRSLWNVKGGKMWFLVWMVGCTAVAGLMQEVP